MAEDFSEVVKTQKEQLAATQKASGLSQKRLARAAELSEQIDAQNQKMEEQRTLLEEQGIDTKSNKKFQAEELKLAKLEKSRAITTGSADAEDAAKQKISDIRGNTFLGKIAAGITGIAKQGMEKVKSGLGGLSKFLMGGLAVAALAFLNNPKFEEIKNTIIDVVVPALAFLYDEIIKPIAEYIGGKLTNLFKDLKSYIDGEKGIGTVLMDNIGTVSAIVLALAVKTLGFGKLLTAIKGIGAALLWVGKGGPITLITSTATKIGAAFTALKTTLVTTVWPAITAKLAAIKGFFIAKLAAMKAFLVPLLPIIAIAAGIALVLYSLKKGFDDFMFELEATGSVWEAVKSGIIGVIKTLFGFPLNLIKSGVSYILEKIGSIFGIESFINASKAMDDFDFVEGITELMTFVGEYFSGLWQRVKDGIQEFLRSSKIGNYAADKIFGTPEEQAVAKKAKEEEQKLFEENRKALREQQKLEKEAAEAEKIKKLKEQQAVPKVPIFERLGNPRGAQAPAQNTVINAPNNVNAPTTNTLTAASTSIINTDRVTDKLSMVS